MRAEEEAPVRGEGRVTLAPVLYATLGGPLAWSLHLGVSYVLVAAGCSTGHAGAGRAGVVAATLLCAGAALAAAGASRRRWRAAAPGTRRREAMTAPHGHGAFVWAAGVVLGLVFALAIVLGGAAALVLPLCTPGGSA
ncbi:MAG TPA: hypothetical protein VFS08_04985 [Gemmatimonadaceae bacterium]|nr:hypothetical protein [Gemmatimonadaceae bacterium]